MMRQEAARNVLRYPNLVQNSTPGLGQIPSVISHVRYVPTLACSAFPLKQYSGAEVGGTTIASVAPAPHGDGSNVHPNPRNRSLLRHDLGPGGPLMSELQKRPPLQTFVLTPRPITRPTDRPSDRPATRAPEQPTARATDRRAETGNHNRNRKMMWPKQCRTVSFGGAQEGGSIKGARNPDNGSPEIWLRLPELGHRPKVTATGTTWHSGAACANLVVPAARMFAQIRALWDRLQPTPLDFGLVFPPHLVDPKPHPNAACTPRSTTRVDHTPPLPPRPHTPALPPRPTSLRRRRPTGVRRGPHRSPSAVANTQPCAGMRRCRRTPAQTRPKRCPRFGPRSRRSGVNRTGSGRVKCGSSGRARRGRGRRTWGPTNRIWVGNGPKAADAGLKVTEALFCSKIPCCRPGLHEGPTPRKLDPTCAQHGHTDARGLATASARRPAARGGGCKSLEALGNVSGDRCRPLGGLGRLLQGLGRRLESLRMARKPCTLWETSGTHVTCARKLLQGLGKPRGRLRTHLASPGTPLSALVKSRKTLGTTWKALGRPWNIFEGPWRSFAEQTEVRKHRFQTHAARHMGTPLFDIRPRSKIDIASNVGRRPPNLFRCPLCSNRVRPMLRRVYQAWCEFELKGAASAILGQARPNLAGG